MAVCWVILRGQQIYTVIQAVHSLLELHDKSLKDRDLDSTPHVILIQHLYDSANYIFKDRRRA